ncbi:MAG TPA: sigma-70 family RNA polymerase sigma factor [Acidimicrobiales bacterium]|nr:sigma-70 family RNA polymerase sigma factor [Acidimicrobiales bacterium]
MSASFISVPTAPAEETADLVRAAGGGDADAWAAVVARYQPRILGIARAYRLNEADAADVAQTVWLQLLRHIDRIRDPQRIGGWVAATARNECLRLCRLRGRVALVDAADVLDAIAAEAEPVAVENEERDAGLRAALDTLPPRQRALVDLLTMDPPLSYGEISGVLDIPVGSIGPTRQRSLRALRETCQALELLPA